MRLFIAEKPSLARAIADVLPKPHRKGDGFIECGNGQVVTWCIGHLLEQAQPDAYDSRYARWNLADLPIVPEKWQLQPRPSVTKQLNVIKRFLHEASEIVHAGDPDREGQLLVDEVLDYLQLAPEKRQQVQRCLINDLNPQAVERAIDRLRSNSEFVPLCVSYSFWQISSTFCALRPKRFAASICNAESENGSGADSDSRLSL